MDIKTMISELTKNYDLKTCVVVETVEEVAFDGTKEYTIVTTYFDTNIGEIAYGHDGVITVIGNTETETAAVTNKYEEVLLMKKAEFSITHGDISLHDVTMVKDGTTLWIYKKGVLVTNIMLRFNKLKFFFSDYSSDHTTREIYFHLVKNNAWRYE
jgi:hypothetical protein